MSDNNFKEIRKQLRTVVRENLESVLQEEMTANIHRLLAEVINKRMNEIAAEAKQTLQIIDNRQKDLQNYLARILETMQPPAPPAAPSETPPSDTL
jgi:ABC-type ATPase with predicted acetyltransferase domain